MVRRDTAGPEFMSGLQVLGIHGLVGIRRHARRGNRLPRMVGESRQRGQHILPDDLVLVRHQREQRGDQFLIGRQLRCALAPA